VANRDAGKNERTRSNPDIFADMNRAPEFQSRSALRGVARMIGGKDLNTRADLCLVADRDGHDIQNHAVEVEEDLVAQRDVETVVAMKRWPNDGLFTHCGEAFQQQLATLRRRHV